MRKPGSIPHQLRGPGLQYRPDRLKICCQSILKCEGGFGWVVVEYCLDKVFVYKHRLGEQSCFNSSKQTLQ